MIGRQRGKPTRTIVQRAGDFLKKTIVGLAIFGAVLFFLHILTLMLVLLLVLTAI